MLLLYIIIFYIKKYPYTKFTVTLEKHMRNLNKFPCTRNHWAKKTLGPQECYGRFKLMQISAFYSLKHFIFDQNVKNERLQKIFGLTSFKIGIVG